MEFMADRNAAMHDDFSLCVIIKKNQFSCIQIQYCYFWQKI